MEKRQSLCDVIQSKCKFFHPFSLSFCGVIETRLIHMPVHVPLLSWSEEKRSHCIEISYFFFWQVTGKSFIFKRKASSNWGYLWLIDLLIWCSTLNSFKLVWIYCFKSACSLFKTFSVVGTQHERWHTQKIRENCGAGRQENFCLLLAPNLSFHYFTSLFSLAAPELTECLEEASSNLQKCDTPHNEEDVTKLLPLCLAKHYIKYGVEMCIFWIIFSLKNFSGIMNTVGHLYYLL